MPLPIVPESGSGSGIPAEDNGKAPGSFPEEDICQRLPPMCKQLDFPAVTARILEVKEEAQLIAAALADYEG